MGCAGSGHRGDVETSSVVSDARCASVTPVESEVLYSRNGSAYTKARTHNTERNKQTPNTVTQRSENARTPQLHHIGKDE